MPNKNLLTSFRWIFFVSRRFALIDRKGRSSITTFLATLGICFGVMTLITVVSVMNGFQMSSVSPIMEISSYHIQVSGVDDESFMDFMDFCEENKRILTVNPFIQSQGLIVGNRDREAASIIRGIDKDIMAKDFGFKKELHMIFGKFDIESSNSIVIGSSLANSLGVNVGSTVNLFALSGGQDVSLFSKNRKFLVTGIFESSYRDINQSFCFINIEDAKKYFGKESNIIYGIKLKDYEDDLTSVSSLKANFPTLKIESWREFNRSFFGALRIEKNILMLLVCLIFVVVGVNIYNGMRRLVYERKDDISILSALGATKNEIKAIFIFRGATSGIIGALFGSLLGVLLSINIHAIFIFASNAIYYIQFFIAMLFNPQNIKYISENSMYEIYASIPARIIFKEVFFIVIFGIISPLVASWKASNNVLKMNVAEVLHDE